MSFLRNPVKTVVEDGVYTPETNKINQHNIDVLTAPTLEDTHSRCHIDWIYILRCENKCINIYVSLPGPCGQFLFRLLANCFMLFYIDLSVFIFPTLLTDIQKPN